MCNKKINCLQLCWRFPWISRELRGSQGLCLDNTCLHAPCTPADDLDSGDVDSVINISHLTQHIPPLEAYTTTCLVCCYVMYTTTWSLYNHLLSSLLHYVYHHLLSSLCTPADDLDSGDVDSVINLSLLTQLIRPLEAYITMNLVSCYIMYTSACLVSCYIMHTTTC